MIIFYKLKELFNFYFYIYLFSQINKSPLLINRLITLFFKISNVKLNLTFTIFLICYILVCFYYNGSYNVMITTSCFINEKLGLSFMDYTTYYLSLMKSDILINKLTLKCQDCESFYRTIGNAVFYDFYESYNFFTLYKILGNAIFYHFHESYNFFTLYKILGNAIFYHFHNSYDFFTLYKIRGNAVFYVDNYDFFTSNTFSEFLSD